MAEQNSEQSRPTEEHPEGTGQRSRRRFIIIGLVAVLVVGALLFWWHSTYYEDTDDASVDGHLVQISARITGHVAKVNVNENQYVEAGHLLVEIDPSDYQTAVNQAQANLEAAIANYEATRVNVPVININAGSNLNNANADVASATAAVAQSETATGSSAGARDRGEGECHQVETRSRPLHAAGAERHHLETAVRRRGGRSRCQPGGRGGSGGESDRRPGRGAHCARSRSCRRSLRRNTRRPLRNRWRSRGPRPIRPQARWIRHVPRWRRRKLNLSYTRNQRAAVRHHHHQERGSLGKTSPSARH